jgi:methyl-accepting chemotaxis protein
MKIGLKLVLSFASVSAICAAVGAIGFWSLSRTTNVIEDVGLEKLPGVQALLTIESSAAHLEAAQRTLLDMGVPMEERLALYGEIAEDEKRYADAWEAYDSLRKADREGEMWTAMASVSTEWATENKDFLAISRRLDDAMRTFSATKRSQSTNYVAAMNDALAMANEITSSFKTQVQEWKNILLRGHDAEQFDRYAASFKREEQSVQTALGELLSLMNDLGLNATPVQKARDAHAAAAVRYTEGLKAFNRAEADAYQKVDNLVQGVDRSVTNALEEVVETVTAAHRAAESLRAEAEHQAMVVCSALQKRLNDQLEQLVEFKKQDAIESVHAGQRIASTSQTLMIGAVVVGTGAALGLGVVISTVIRRGINAMVLRLKDIAEGEGDLTQRVDASRKDELGELGRWFNAFVEKVQGIMVEINESSASVASAATEIAASNEEMSAGLAEQADQVAQVSAATEEMSATSQEVANKSSEGKGVVEETVKRIEEIAGEVKASAVAVNTLGQKSEEIGQIIAVINDIADQTNLLALNAAIEAARAGEHGRGFAVVADEVRKLAERTTQATEQVGTSIREIQQETEGAVRRMEAGTQKVQGGVEFARQAGDALSSIVAAAEQQSGATIEISRSVEQINSVASQSREGAQQAAAAAAQLSSEAEKLQALVGKFKM